MNKLHTYTAIVQYKYDVIVPKTWPLGKPTTETKIETSIVKGITSKEIDTGMVTHKLQKILVGKQIISYDLFLPAVLRVGKRQLSKRREVVYDKGLLQEIKE